MSIRVCVDVGGTFTDLVLVDDQGHIRTFKAPTTPEDYANGTMAAFRKAAEAGKVSLEEMMKACSTPEGGAFFHGSTITTNAMVEGKAAKTGLICTRGFRDILTTREGGKEDPYDWDLDYPEPYIPRYLTLPVTERINAEGGIETPIVEDEVREVLRQLREWNVEAIAVSLLWSIVNPEHELLVARIIEQELPGIPYTLGHQVNPCIREYRRTSSAAIDASLKPVIRDYAGNFEKRLEQQGYTGEMLMLTSGGGVMGVDQIQDKPIYSIDGGPALAPNAGLWYAGQELGEENVIACDMGGTSFDVSCVTAGEIPVSREATHGPYLLGINKVDINTIGAGGGSIAWVDPGGLLHVGPQSAGAVPGPACYGKGGREPTVTDASVLLGYVDPDYFLGGEMKLDPRLSEEVIHEKVARTLKLSVEEAAFTIWNTININMTTAILDITVKQGIDPREYLFVSGGGAAGMHILPIVTELGARTVLLPKTAGTISAVGGVFADIVGEVSASRFTDSLRFDFEGINHVLTDLEKEAERFLEKAGVEPNARRIEFHVEARYGYQVWELSVPLRGRRINDAADLEALIEDFHQIHERVFAFKDPGQYIECIYWRAKAIGEIPKPQAMKIPEEGEDASGAIKAKRRAFFKDLGGMAETPIYDGGKMKPGNRIAGPAVIEEPTTTVVVFPGSSATVTQLGSYLLETQ